MKALAEQIEELDGAEIYGRVVDVRGLMGEVAGRIHAMPVGARVVVETGPDHAIPCEVVGFSNANALLMPFAALEGVRRGCRAIVTGVAAGVRPCRGWLRRGGGGGGQGRADRRQGTDTAGALALSVPQRAAAGAFAPAGGRSARSRGARPEHL